MSRPGRRESSRFERGVRRVSTIEMDTFQKDMHARRVSKTAPGMRVRRSSTALHPLRPTRHDVPRGAPPDDSSLRLPGDYRLECHEKKPAGRQKIMRRTSTNMGAGLPVTPANESSRDDVGGYTSCCLHLMLPLQWVNCRGVNVRWRMDMDWSNYQELMGIRGDGIGVCSRWDEGEPMPNAMLSMKQIIPSGALPTCVDGAEQSEKTDEETERHTSVGCSKMDMSREGNGIHGTCPVLMVITQADWFGKGISEKDHSAAAAAAAAVPGPRFRGLPGAPRAPPPGPRPRRTALEFRVAIDVADAARIQGRCCEATVGKRGVLRLVYRNESMEKTAEETVRANEARIRNMFQLSTRRRPGDGFDALNGSRVLASMLSLGYLTPPTRHYGDRLPPVVSLVPALPPRLTKDRAPMLSSPSSSFSPVGVRGGRAKVRRRPGTAPSGIRRSGPGSIRRSGPYSNISGITGKARVAAVDPAATARRAATEDRKPSGFRERLERFHDLAASLKLARMRHTAQSEIRYNAVGCVPRRKKKQQFRS